MYMYAMIVRIQYSLYTYAHVHGMAVVVTMKYDASKMSTTIAVAKELQGLVSPLKKYFFARGLPSAS